MRSPLVSPVEAVIRPLRVLIVEERQHLRKLIRSLLVNIGIKKIDEVGDGIAGVEAVKALDPDLVILAWELPLLNGAELLRIIRAPGVVAKPNLPIIMFGATTNGRRVAEAKRLGVSSYLVLPISANMLRERIISSLGPLPQPTAPEAKADGPDGVVFIG
jgi:DNA-binding response OmpR family regulator